MGDAPMTDSRRSALLMPPGVLQPFPLRFRRDDLHVMAFFEGHPQYGAVEAMIRSRADSGYSIRAILTRHDQSQIDHINDDALLAAFRGTERERYHREIALEAESSATGRRARLEFLSSAGERVVLDLVTVGQPDVKQGGLSDPGRHSPNSSLPLMWRGASTLAGARTKVTIDEVEYPVPVKLRAGTFIAHEGYYTEPHSMGVIRAGTVSTRLLKKPDRLEVGAEWLLQSDDREMAYRVTAVGADGMLRIARLDGSGEIITAHAVEDRLAVTRISLPADAGRVDGLVLAFDRDAGFSLSIEGEPDVVTGRVHVEEGTDESVIKLSPSHPGWAADRIVRVACSRAGDRMTFVTTIGRWVSKHPAMPATRSIRSTAMRW
jgi:hypothetical protein